MSRRARTYAATALALVVAMTLGAFAVLRPFSSHAALPGGGLSKHDREIIATAVVNNQRTVTFVIAARPGASRDVASGIAGLGGTVNYQDDAVDYLRATVPTGHALEVGNLGGIQAANVDEVVPLDDPAPEATGAEAVPAPGPGTPSQNAYMPTRDIGAPQFVAAHPTYDGRGVVIGILDTGVDLLTPELQGAKDLSGNPVRKIINWRTATDPLSDGDPTWLNMATQVSVSGGAFTAGGNSYTGVAADGTYRFGVFHEADLGGASEYAIGCGADVNRNGVCDESFAVLWRTSDNLVWVDANADKSFAGESAMTDFSAHHDMRTFGTDNLATAERDSVPFVVQTDGKNKFVNIGIVSGSHATHVAGIAAGKGFFGGAFNGAAPEAQIVSVRACMFVSGCTAHALIEGMIYLEKQANVDVINMSIGGLPALNDGNNARATLYNRLIRLSKAQMFISAGNSGPGINTVGDPSVASDVMSVGAYVTKDSWFYNYGAVAAKNDGMFVFSSRGPREDGGFKPDIVAPGSAVSSVPAWQPGQPVAGTYALPPGYGMFNGTSMAAPEATGGAALLISAAKQSNVQYKPEQLRAAIKSSARYLPAYGAHEQGNGLFRVGAAWDLLKTNLTTTDIGSSAPVNTVLSGLLATPGKGRGIYEREGWVAGQSGDRAITFTRTSGGAQPITYAIEWVGNDGTFSSAGTLTLGQNAPATLSVHIAVGTTGVHSAILNLREPGASTIAYQTMNTIVAAEQFSAPTYSVTRSGSADRPDATRLFFNVPANTPAFKVDLTGVSGRVRIQRFHPYGVLTPADATRGYQTGGSQSVTLSRPFPGVWEVTVDASRTSAVSPATFTITGTIMGVDVSPSAWTVDPASAGSAYSQGFTFTNRFGAFTGGAVGTALGSAQRLHPTIAAGGAQQVRFITVAAGATSISAQISNASDTGADLDLYLFDCHTGSCVLRASSTSSTSNESVSVASPAAGTWATLVDPYSVPAGSTTYDYFDAFADAAYFGAISTTDAPALRASGASWTTTASVTPLHAPAAGRFLQGFVQVVSGSSVLGSAEAALKF